MSNTDFITALGDNWVSLLIAGMPYLGSTYGGTCATATEAKSVFDLGQINTPAVIVVLAGMEFGKPQNMVDFTLQATVTWRCYIVGANFNRATGPGRFPGELGEPGTNQMVADMRATCHGQLISSYITPGMQGARLAPRRMSLMEVTNSKIIYEFDWWHFWPLVQAN